MTYLKSGLQINRYVPADWGPLDVYVEVAEDLFANRCVYVYECGRCLRYDRTNHRDEFGSLGMAKYDAVKWEQWWGPSLTIAARDFERIWTDAAHAMNQPQNYDSSHPWFIPPFA